MKESGECIQKGIYEETIFVQCNLDNEKAGGNIQLHLHHYLKDLSIYFLV